MTVDRGGLRYKIDIQSVGLGDLIKFNKELTKTRKEIKKVSTAQVKAVQAQTKLTRAREQANREIIKTRKEQVKLRIEELKLRVVTEKLRKENTNLAAATFRAATAQERLRQATEGVARATRRASGNTRRLSRDLKNVESRGNRVSFTFRRLFGILAAFAAARIAVRAFRDIIEQGVSFNAFIESATLGIRSLLAATGQVFGARGQLVTGLEKFNLTAQIADEQLIKIREDAQNTAATLRTLIDTFQIALAPGLVAGLDPDQIRKLTVRIAQAAAAIGLPQNQLAEEIRSLLAGTIQARTTRIATALGITNEDIRRAKEAGTLFQFIEDRFNAFGAASEEALGTLATLLSNLKDQLDALLGAEFLDFFEQLKVGLAQLRGELASDDASEFAAALGQSLSIALNALKELASGVGFGGVTAFLEAFNVGLRNALNIAAQLTAQLVKGLGDAVRVGANLFDFFVRIGSALGLDGVLGFVIRWVVALRTVRFLVNAIVRGFRVMVGLVGLLALRTARTARVMRAFSAASAAAAVSVGGLARIFRGIFLAGGGILRAVTKLAVPLGVVLLIADAIFGIFSSSKDEVEDTAEEVNRYANILSQIPPLVSAANQELAKQSRAVEDLSKKSAKLQSQLDVTLLSEGLGRIAARVVALVSAAQLEATTQLKATQKAQTQNLIDQADIQRRLIAQQQVLGRERGLDKDTLDELVKLTQDQVETAGRSVDKERLIRTLTFQQLQARNKENKDRIAGERELAQNQLRSIEARLARLNKARRTREDQLSGEDPEAAGAITSAVNERVRLLQQVSKLRFEEKAAAGSILDIEKIIGQQSALRVAAFLSSQIPAIRQSNDLLALEVGLLKQRNAQFLDRDAIGERRQRIVEQEARLRFTRETQKAENIASIASLRSLRSEVQGRKGKEKIDLAIAEIQRKEQLQRETSIAQNAVVNRQLDALGRTARALSRTRPISSALRANPEAIASLRTAQRLLRPLQQSLRDLAATANENAIRDQFRDVASEAVRVQRLVGRFQRDQLRFIDATDDRLVKLRNTLKKAQTDEEAIRGRILEGDTATTTRILAAVNEALRTGATRVDQTFRDAFKIDPNNLERARKVFIQILTVRRKAARTAQEIAEVEKAREVGLGLLNIAFATRLANLTAELALEKSISAEKAKQGLALAQITAGGDPLRGTATSKRIAGLKAEAAAIQFQSRVEQDRSARQVASFRQQQKRIKDNQKAFDALGRSIASETERSRFEVDRLNISLERTKAELDRIGDGTFSDGLRVGFEDAFDSLDAFQSAVTIANELVTGLSTALAEALLEPAEAGAKLEQFFRGLVSTILSEIIKLAIIKPLLEAIGLAGSVKLTFDTASLITASLALAESAVSLGAAGLILDGAAGALSAAAAALALSLGGAGLARGGPVVGRAGGGTIPSPMPGARAPAGLSSVDRVPIFAQEGEFMMRLRAVRSYGLDVMNALNQGLVDPFQMRAMVGLASHRRGGQGLALGGEVAARRGRESGGVQTIVIQSEKVVDDGYNDNLARQQVALGRLPRTVADTRRR